ncbi:hypothetical protein [Shouchella shacheensis]|uniref:hypothetical protein n=1 Tax=Shouchella shacheensis TaxID=1649580 RepID=UPI0007402C40|nr:hypothetical protein [Shouchella shacheensis]
MFGLLLTDKEVQEVEYLLKRELEELLQDLADPKIDGVVKRVMKEKYQLVFGLYKRFAPPNERMKFVLNGELHKVSDSDEKV